MTGDKYCRNGVGARTLFQDTAVRSFPGPLARIESAMAGATSLCIALLVSIQVPLYTGEAILTAGPMPTEDSSFTGEVCLRT